MNKKKTVVIPGSLRDQLLRYFEANPTEELTYADVETKFGFPQADVAKLAVRMAAKGEIEKLHIIRRPAGRAP